MRYRWAGELSFKVKFPNEVTEEQVANLLQTEEWGTILDPGPIHDIHVFVAKLEEFSKSLGGRLEWDCGGL